MTRIAIVGAGGVAQRHAQVLSSLDDVRVVAVSDLDEEAATALAATCDAPAFTDVEQALDASAPDAVYVCVPPFAHGLPEKAVLARRLPLFVEKPVAADLATAEELGALVEDAGVVTGTGYHWRYLDVLDEARSLLSDSPALLAHGSWLDKRPPVGWWPYADRSGGQFVEQVTHLLDLARVLLGEATSVYAVGIRDDETEGDVDDATVATVRFASGAVATFTATSLLAAKHEASLQTFGRRLRLEVSESGLVVDDGTSPRTREPAADARVEVDRDFVAVVRGEHGATRAPYAEALASHRLGWAITESARTGSLVRL